MPAFSKPANADPKRRKQRCDRCGRPFGLILQRYGLKRFCSGACKQAYQAERAFPWRRKPQ